MTIILVDSATRAMLAAADHPSGIAFLNESMLDTYHVPNVERPNYLGQCFTSTVPPEDYPAWTWKKGQRKFVALRTDLLTASLRDKANLAQVKLRAFQQMQMHLNTSRNRLASGIALQETVYMLKFIEATRFRDCGYDEARILEFPYVLQYSEIAGIPLRQAADDIHLKARFDAHFLLNTEGLRLKYFDRLKVAQAPDGIRRIVEDFRAEMFTNTMV